eukprot:CAMPEP_0119017388 /NCGR_PEP_ID=MMETSP1176-20130426/16416_1 /TAXON_ID=265551 /ORGANISM="Synedropsis recta cf, Strain CCMP1620" /LENGTH=241 /DNA_ID=CAMNT_0006971099 /DNA_START=46 /DNA_END=771 /DNA_ORIENTATION=-
MASLMFAAPIFDLREALQRGSFGNLNPVPWAAMTGNCLGWVAYSYYTKDPFVLASNVPGLILSFWLNSGASKLQYYELATSIKASGESTVGNEEVVTMPQESLLLRILVAWGVILVWVGWIQQSYSPALIVGICVNVNLVFFYGAPLEAMWRVIRSQSSDAIHVPTMIMNWINTTFWMAYGFARQDPIIYLPNGIGLVMGILQGILVCLFPRRRRGEDDEDDESNVGLVDEDTRQEQGLVV